MDQFVADLSQGTLGLSAKQDNVVKAQGSRQAQGYGLGSGVGA